MDEGPWAYLQERCKLFLDNLKFWSRLYCSALYSMQYFTHRGNLLQTFDRERYWMKDEGMVCRGYKKEQERAKKTWRSQAEPPVLLIERKSRKIDDWTRLAIEYNEKFLIETSDF